MIYLTFIYLFNQFCYRDITIIIVIVIDELKLFLYQNSKKQEKKAATNFTLLCRSRNLIMRCMKTYLHRSIMILQFLPGGSTKKLLTLAFSTIHLLKAESYIWKGILPHCFVVSPTSQLQHCNGYFQWL